MRRFILMLIAVALCWVVPMVAFGQTSVQVVDMNGNVNTYSVRTYDLQPKVIPIRPYGLNLKPANIPDRARPFVPAYKPYNPGPVTIENPFYIPERDHFPEPENSLFQEIFQAIGELYAYARLH